MVVALRFNKLLYIGGTEAKKRTELHYRYFGGATGSMVADPAFRYTKEFRSLQGVPQMFGG